MPLRYLVPLALRTSGANTIKEQGSDCSPVKLISYTIFDLKNISKKSVVEEIHVNVNGLQLALDKVHLFHI